ncbi:hypothetical protein GCM10009557_58030 [Virgisporangium ochraceum]
MSIKVVVVDDQALVRGGFAMILRTHADIDVVAEAGTGYEAIDAARQHRPDVILMDIRMPDLDGLEATARILREADWPVRVLILTTFDPDEYVYQALRVGASGFVLKDIPPQQLATAVRTVADGGALIDPSITRRLISRFAVPPSANPAVADRARRLTDRERDVVVAVARGATNTEIADGLRIGPSTVKSHISSVLTKLGLRDRTQIVVFAYESSLVEPGTHDIASGHRVLPRVATRKGARRQAGPRALNRGIEGAQTARSERAETPESSCHRRPESGGAPRRPAPRDPGRPYLGSEVSVSTTPDSHLGRRRVIVGLFLPGGSLQAEYRSRPACVGDALVEGCAHRALLEAEMRLHDRRQAVELTLQLRQRRTVGRSRSAVRQVEARGGRGHVGDPLEDRADHLVVLDQFGDLSGEVGAGLRQLGEHAGVLALVVGGQRGAERQAVGRQGNGLGAAQV